MDTGRGALSTCGNWPRNSSCRSSSSWRGHQQRTRAIADLDEAIRLDPTKSVAYTNRGHAWNEKGEYEKAIADLDEALRRKPDYAQAIEGRVKARRALRARE